MEAEPERAKLAAKYEEWHIFRRGTFVCAWLPGVSGVLVEFRDMSVAGLEARLEEFDRVWADSASLSAGERAAAALAAAENLKT